MVRLGELARSRGDTDTATRVLGDALCLSDAGPDGYLRDFVLQHLGKVLRAEVALAAARGSLGA